MKKIFEMTNCCEAEEWDDSLELLDKVLKKSRIKEAFLTIVDSGWRRLEGKTDIFKLTATDLVNKLGSFEWNLNVYKKGNQLILIRYSHDEPCGATILVRSSRHYNEF